MKAIIILLLIGLFVLLLSACTPKNMCHTYDKHGYGVQKTRFARK